jgi:NTP pyrophosphatase (non-canonical NTP hydrolase)
MNGSKASSGAKNRHDRYILAGISPFPDGRMTLEEAQKRIDTWIREYGVRYFSELTNTAILMEEVGELARLMARTYGDQSFKKSDEGRDLGDEMADILFVLLCLANQTGVDLTAAMERNLEKKTVRDADRHKQNPKLNP